MPTPSKKKIVGPFCVFKIRLGSRIFLLFGEDHSISGDHVLHPDQLYFDDFIHDMIRKKSTVAYDFFIESPLKADVDRDYGRTRSFMIPRLLRRLAVSSRPVNVKIHHMDFRHHRTLVGQDQTRDDTLKTVMDLYADEFHSFDDPHAKKEFFQNYRRNRWMQPRLIRLLMLRTFFTHPKIRRQLARMEDGLKAEIYTQCIRIIDENLASLTEHLEQAGLFPTATTKKMPSTFTDDLYRKIVHRAADVFCLLMDLYCLARFFKSSTGDHIIIYAGALHVFTYVDVLVRLGGRIIYEHSPDQILATIPKNQHISI